MIGLLQLILPFFSGDNKTNQPVITRKQALLHLQPFHASIPSPRYSLSHFNATVPFPNNFIVMYDWHISE